jgi:hypothetical protein
MTKKWQKHDNASRKMQFLPPAKVQFFLSLFCHFVENLSFFCRFGASFSKLVKKIEFFFEKWQKNDRQNWNDKKTTKTWQKTWTDKTEMTKKTTKKWQKKWQTKLKWQKNDKKMTKKMTDKTEMTKKMTKKTTKKWQNKYLNHLQGMAASFF